MNRDRARGWQSLGRADHCRLVSLAGTRRLVNRENPPAGQPGKALRLIVRARTRRQVDRPKPPTDRDRLNTLYYDLRPI